MLFLDRLVDMNRRIGLTGNKLLYPLRHEATSPAFTAEGQRAKYTVCIFCSMQRAASLPFSVGKCRGRSKHWKQSHVLATGPDRRNSSSHKNTGCRPYNGDTLWISNDWNHTVCSWCRYPFWSTQKPPHAEHNKLQHIFQVKLSLWC